MLCEFGAVPVPPLMSKKLNPNNSIAITDFSQIGVFTKFICSLTNMKLRYNPESSNAKNTDTVKKIGDEPPEAKDSLGVRMANSITLELTLLPHSR